MNAASPLRYPGGKASLANVLVQIRELNNLNNRGIIEPFAGGAGASLSLLFDELATAIHINDRDLGLFDFWWSLTKWCDRFVARLKSTKVNMTEWRRQRDIYRSERRVSRLERGFATFYLNRCNRSGVIFNGGPIGGVAQAGKWKLGARFNKEELINRCERVGGFSARIKITGVDGIEILRDLQTDKNFFFVDPPYFHKGQSLYLNVANASYHHRLAQQLKTMTSDAWVLTYDDCPEIRKLYAGWTNMHAFSLRYSASERRGGQEILVTPKWMKIPSSQRSKAIVW